MERLGLSDVVITYGDNTYGCTYTCTHIYDAKSFRKKKEGLWICIDRLSENRGGRDVQAGEREKLNVASFVLFPRIELLLFS